MERDVPGAFELPGLDPSGVVEGQRTCSGVECGDEDAILAAVGDRQPPPGGIEDDVMGIGAQLRGLVWAGRSGEFEGTGRRFQGAVGPDRQGHHGSGNREESDDQPVSSGVEGEVDGVAAAHVDGVEQRQSAARGVDGEGADGRSVAVDGVEAGCRSGLSARKDGLTGIAPGGVGVVVSPSAGTVWSRFQESWPGSIRQTVMPAPRALRCRVVREPM
jgi:hypothetical protein